MSEHIEIIAETTPGSDECTFTVDRPIYEGGTLLCASREAAKGSPLLEELFEIAGVARVVVEGSSIIITKNLPDPWEEMGEEIGDSIRDVLDFGGELFAPDATERLAPRQANISSDLARKIQKVIDDQINPGVASHGGWVELVHVEDDSGRVFLNLGGGCQGCGMAQMTLKQGIEVAIKKAAPEVTEVLDQTDHAAGANPYYQSR